jgi:hypothetical protein
MKITNEKAVDEEHQKEIDEVRHQMFLKSMDKQKRAHLKFMFMIWVSIGLKKV